jgi:hypothetical protein
MPTVCPFCARENAESATVCASCSRDIAVPASLIVERDDLAHKRDILRERLADARRELDALKRDRKRRAN